MTGPSDLGTRACPQERNPTCPVHQARSCYAAQAFGQPRPPLDAARSAAQTVRSARGAMDLAATAACFHLRSAAALSSGFSSRRHSAYAPLLPLADYRPKPIQSLVS